MLGAKVTLDEALDRVEVRVKFGEHVASHWVEIGFLLGQWTSQVGINFPEGFSTSTAFGSPPFRFDVDPEAMTFGFNVN